MRQHLQLLRLLPTRTHLIAISACVLFFAGAMLLPSSDVAANKQQSITLKAPQSDTAAPQQLAPIPKPISATPAATTTSPAKTTLAMLTPVEQPKVVAAPAEVAPAAKVAEPEHPAEDWLSIQIRSGDNLTTLFKKAGLGANQLYPMLNGIKPSKALARLKPGQTLEFLIDQGELLKLRHITSPLTQTLVSRGDDSYKIEAIEFTPEITHSYRQGTIEDSLFLSASEAGLSQTKIMELAGIFGWDVDFVLDIRKGDQFEVVYEERWLDGKKIGEGNIVAATFVNQGNTFQAIRYTDSNGDSNYFTPEGKSMRKAFLRTPVDFTRISSKFNPNRKHPIFKTKRPHRGVDYAAPTGTPIKSAGDGKVIFAGRKGGYGKVVIVQHGQKYTTLYAHMSRIKPGMKRGKRVKQGNTIGYVGSTGYATGPHLHYEFRLNGVHRNPLTVKLPQAAPLPKKEMSRFKQQAAEQLAMLEGYRQTQLAQN
ncbi:OapA family protein [Motiliproteus sp.]|uniref:OapA family protein n=1 Tax=Motiliproteus sp. TaxID=1898955 RepID=UPI003BAC249B